MEETQFDVQRRAEGLLEHLSSDARLGRFVDTSLGIPQPFHGSGEIRLIVLGQDPTAKDVSSRAGIKTVLNLDRRGGLRIYLTRICSDLDLDLDENVYATSLFKNFFVRQPKQIEEIDVFQEFSPIWLPLLQDELARFPQVPVITLGQPLLATLVREGASPQVRDYWGYTPRWKSGEAGPFQYLKPGENHLDRTIFPFPHQTSIRKPFYKEHLRDYTAFVKNAL